MKKEPNERSSYERVVQSGFVREGDPNFSELLALAKNIRQTKGYGTKNIIKYLTSFCLGEDEFFNPILSANLLNSVARAAIKNTEFRRINFPIRIVQDEIDAIRKVENFKFQNILLATLVIAKSSGNPRVFSDNPNQIYHIIEVSGQSYSNTLFIEELSHMAKLEGVFKYVKNRYQFYALTCGSSGDVVIGLETEDDYYNLSEIYRKFIGGELIWCEDCGVELLKSGRRHRYCDGCSKQRVKVRETNRIRKKR